MPAPPDWACNPPEAAAKAAEMAVASTVRVSFSELELGLDLDFILILSMRLYFLNYCSLYDRAFQDSKLHLKRQLILLPNGAKGTACFVSLIELRSHY